MHHELHMQIAHWLGVALALPAAAVVFVASWRSLARRGAGRGERALTPGADGERS